MAEEFDPVTELHLSVQERIQRAISRLPVLTKSEVPLDDQCPICITPFDAIMDGKTREGQDSDDPIPEELAGVTKLAGCGHIFCRSCLVEWIRGRHGTCPSCRNVFSSIRPPSDSDNESSDGDYVPDDEDEDEDDGFFDSDDAFMDTESAFDDMEVEEDMDMEEAFEDDDIAFRVWGTPLAHEGYIEDPMDNWGLSDGDGDGSDSVSEVEGLTMSGELPVQEDGAGVYSDTGEGSGVLHAPADEATGSK